MPGASEFPVFLNLHARAVLVVGAGAVAERKIRELVRAGARVRVVALSANAEVRELAREGAIVLEERAFVDADIDEAWLVVSATGDKNVAAQVFSAGEARGKFVLAVDDPARGSAASGGVIRRAPFVVAISSSAEVPAMTRLLREVLERALPEDRWIRVARELRAKWKRTGTPMGSRFEELVRAVMTRDEE